MWKVEIGGGGGGSKNVESGNWGVKNCGKWKLGGGGGADTPPPPIYEIVPAHLLGGRRSPAVACWASDHWVVGSNPLRVKFRH